MSAKHHPRTLAKTLTTIAWRSPAELGLFWDPDGSMPWKELYLALHEDPELRFVRDSHIRELALLGMEIPFLVDGNKVRLRPGFTAPVYAAAMSVPERLYMAVRPSGVISFKTNGLRSAGRPLSPLFADRALALRVAARRHEEPLPVEVLAGGALASGVSFLDAGPGLFLVKEVPAEFLILPVVRQEDAEPPAARSRAKPQKVAPTPVSPGSFMVEPGHLFAIPAATKSDNASGKQARRNDDWKKERRRERRKRDI
jgi:putative RNA 2'-phosphotransferase